MTSAEFKTIRQTIGLSAQVLAELVGLDLRSVQRMESGITRPREAATQKLQSLYDLFNLICKSHESGLNQVIEMNKKPSEIVLIRYRKEDFEQYNTDFQEFGLPESVHSATLCRFKFFAEQKAIDVKIIYFDPQAYKIFLGTDIDSDANRARWAALAYKNFETSPEINNKEEFQQ